MILGAANAAGVPVSSTSPVTGGNMVSLTVSGLQDQTGALPAPASVNITVAGVSTNPQAISGSGTSQSVLQFAVPAGLAPGPQTLTLQVGTRVSVPFPINLY
jgi:hypothetical protein